MTGLLLRGIENKETSCQVLRRRSVFSYWQENAPSSFSSIKPVFAECPSVTRSVSVAGAEKVDSVIMTTHIYMFQKRS